jgi:hypothetical protein
VVVRLFDFVNNLWFWFWFSVYKIEEPPVLVFLKKIGIKGYWDFEKKSKSWQFCGRKYG